ncbi:MAG: extracellular solute-binding protein, partial [Defluviitaleaceae bacterium]|nr:extracellular solute-binding protein [Defluviitaleaceae bacterium]
MSLRVLLAALVALLTFLFGAFVVFAATVPITYSEYTRRHGRTPGTLSDGADYLAINAINFHEAEDYSVVTVRLDGEDVQMLYTGEVSTVTYRIHVQTAGMYYIDVVYKTIPGGFSITRSVLINGQLPFREAGGIVWDRFFADANQNHRLQERNQTFPRQVEQQIHRRTSMFSANGHVPERLMFRLDAGYNYVTFEAIEAPVYLHQIIITPAIPLPSYEEYLAFHEGAGASRIASADADLRVQGQDATLKTSPALFPINDRSCPLMEPYHFTFVRINAIGGAQWNVPRQLIEWQVYVPEAGLYRIAIRYKQEWIVGAFSTRRLRINHEIPFIEAEDLRFNFTTNYNVAYLGNDYHDFYFFLNAGYNTISLEAVMGVFGEFAAEVEDIMRVLTEAWRDMLVLTGSTPDINRSYDLHLNIPDLFPRFYIQRERLIDIVYKINNISGDFVQSTTILDNMIFTLTRIIDEPLEIIRHFTNFRIGITALGSWIMEAQNQSLTIDWFEIATEDFVMPRGRAGFWARFWHGLRQFIGSFFNDFGMDLSEFAYGDGATIDVWISTGMEQFQILRRLISESFTPYYGINVRLRLVDTGVIFPATVTGRGPDVALGLAASAPTNFGFRGAALDLSQFDDFEEVAQRFLPAAVETFTFQDQVFALPDSMAFPVTFIRTDIFRELEIEPPTTWDEFVALIPALMRNNMDVYLQTGAQANIGTGGMGNAANVNPIYAALLFQAGGELYNDEGVSTAIDSDIGIRVFARYVELYTLHDVIFQTDFLTRFRLGEIPIAIMDLTVFNALAAGAPEIAGDWQMFLIPGTEQEDGTVRHDIPITVSGALIIENIAARNDVIDEAWDFIKWWTSEE